MADRIQFRRDTIANWTKANPVLLEGEVGYVTDNPNQYKIGDGIHAWNDLPLRGFTGTITQDMGNDENAVMSQKIISELFKIIDANKLPKVPILDASVCSNGSRYTQIENCILDLEITADDDRKFAPTSFFFDGTENFRITFYEVDEKGIYLSSFNRFSIDFGTKNRGMLYDIDRDYSAKDGCKVHCSIIVDGGAITEKFEAYAPSLVSSECKKEHWGLIAILRTIQANQDEAINIISGSTIPLEYPIKALNTSSVASNWTKDRTTNSFVFNNTTDSSKWTYIKVGTLQEFNTLDDYSKLNVLITFYAENLLEDESVIKLYRANSTGYVEGKNAVVKTINKTGFVSYTAKLSSIIYEEGLYFWIQGVPGVKWKISNLKITIAPSNTSFINGESIDSALTSIDSALTYMSDVKQSRISLFDMAKCSSNSKISQLNDFLLDLEIDWDNEPTETYAIVSVDGSEGNRTVTFYDVDENGRHTSNFYSFNVKFDTTKSGVQYALDKLISVNGNTGKVSIVVDWDKWNTLNQAMNPCYHSKGVYSEHVGPIKYLRELKKLGVELSSLDITDILNGSKKIYLTSIDNTGEYVIDKINNSFTISTNNPGDSWSFTNPPFTPTGNNYVYIKFKLKCLTPELLEQGATNNATLWLSDGRSNYVTNKCVSVGHYKDGDEVHYSFDPAYYTVYKDWTEFGVWIAVSAGTSGGTVKWQVSDFEVYELENRVNGLDGENLKEVLDNAASKINTLDETVSDFASSDTKLISPSGSKFELSVQDDGTLVALPIVPTKGVMFGNSLIRGNGFGMAASDNEHDYFYLITEAIKTLNPSYTSTRPTALQTGDFEGLTSEGEIDAVVKKMTGILTGDEDLVSIQLGDNVNTPKKNAVFQKSSLALCKAMRAKCPKARIVWMGMWFGSDERYTNIQNACNSTGCKFISYKDILGADANGKIGGVQKLGTGSRTINGVTNVKENSSSGGTKNITVTFTVNRQSYESTLDVTEYSLGGTTLSYTSDYSVITAGGVAAHPGNEGFRRIANKFLYEMGLTDDKEYYSTEKGNWEDKQY